MMTDLQKHLGGVTDPAVLAELESWYADYYQQAIARFEQLALYANAHATTRAVALAWCSQSVAIPDALPRPAPDADVEAFQRWLTVDMERRIAECDVRIRADIQQLLTGTLH